MSKENSTMTALAAYLFITEEAISHAKEGEIAAVTESLDRREELIRRLRERSETDGEKEPIRALVEKIQAKEEELQKHLRRLRDEAKEHLSRIHRGKIVRSGYMQSYEPPEGGFIDRRVGESRRGYRSFPR